jgi:methionine-rich copper-binding protein CopC
MTRYLKTISSLCLVLSAMLLSLALAPGVALAHAHLESSTPAEGATVAPGLTTITLNLTEEVSVDQSTAQLLSADGSPVAGATGSVDRAGRKTLTITTPALTEGKYSVKWHAVTEDDNGITDGTLSFTVAAAGASTSSGESTTTTTGGSSLPSAGAGTNVLIALAAAVGALGLSIGGLALRRRSQV